MHGRHLTPLDREVIAQLLAQGCSRAPVARPYHAWERGLNENTNRLLRQFLPKGLDLRGATHPYVKSVEHLLNTRPRKSLGYRTPHEVLRE
jgi:IS30 family transposase